MELYNRPFRFQPNKIPYLIPGGELIDGFLGEGDENPTASQLWIASTVACGLDPFRSSASWLLEEDGGGSFPEILKIYKEKILGKRHYEAFGAEPGFLLKLLNSSSRLLVQVHPDKEMAKKHFDLPFGKTEAWYVLGKKDPGVPAYIYAGLKPWVTRELLKKLIEKQDTKAILSCLYEFEIQPHDVILITSGLAHAIGADSLIAEIQEPVDLTLRAERVRPDQSVLPEESMHGGIGIDGMLECFHFTCESRREVEKRIFLSQREIRKEGRAREVSLIDDSQTPCFSMNRITCEGRYEKENHGFLIGLGLEGEGFIQGGGMKMPIKRGTQYMIPYGVVKYRYVAENSLTVLECYPPKRR